ncbi:hypothetical protein OESDEN_03673 [Oesophagostomum dentatum]|uniref:Uncharacterized protein n=1 Tax=Oesophagostomum dentatum TaxID=61180 RepID=A0A0B1TFN1_OESDE|nr:hypothetical protein OESDEN_03673 [Oesophagostomum dentatum]
MSVYVLNLAEAEGNMVKGLEFPILIHPGDTLAMDFYRPSEYSESYKFIRMADDLHDVATYLADMRLCFILVTATGYLLLFVYLIMLCIRRNRRTQPRRRNWDYQLENQREFTSTGPQNTEDLVGVRSDGNAGYMGRNHHGRGLTNTAPSFMRHGHINHQQTTRLMADQDGSVKHQIPHITTEPPTEENKAKVPQLVKDSIES